MDLITPDTNEVAQTNAGDGSALTPTPQRRKFLADDGDDVSSSGGVDLDDSGNYSSCSVASDGAEMQQNCMRYQHLLREKEQCLFLAIQDVRKLRSELERLGKSEQWYKQELRQQKSTRLEALERLYTQERKYMQENQRLQRECVRLYAKCAEMEEDLEAQKQRAVAELKVEQAVAEQDDFHSSQFEIEQQQALIIDQQQLIAVLRKQKRALLEDLQRLTEEKDAKVLELQRTLADMELENTHMTSKCKQLLDERQQLVVQLQSKADKCAADHAERERLHNVIGELRDQLELQEKLLAQREGEILDLQSQFKANMHAETNVDEVHRLSVSYHEEINAKTQEIRTLKTSMCQLQAELVSLGNLQAQTEQQERQIENLNFTLEARQFELQNLQQTDANKTEQIAELQLNLESCLGERETEKQQLHDVRIKMKTAESELMALHEKYASMCALCERTKFELQLREIEEKKLQFQTASDRRDIEQLRDKLRTYLHTTTELSGKIASLEAALDSKSSVKAERQLEVASHDDAECVAYERALQENLLKSKQIIQQLQEDNQMLRQQQLEFEELKAGIRLENDALNKRAITTESMAELVNETREVKSFVHERETIVQLQQTVQQKTQECNKLSVELKCKGDDFKSLQLELLKRDAQLYKQARSERQRNDFNAESFSALQAECAQLSDELHCLRAAKLQLETELDGERANVKALNNQLNEMRLAKTFAEQEVQTDEAEALPDANKNERVQLLQQMLQQQNERVQQLHAVQEEWEELLSALNETQKMEETNRQELAIKRAELEELNELFAEQNEELQQLQQHNYQMQQRQHTDAARMQQTFQTQLDELTIQLEEKQVESEEKQIVIATLQQTNARLQQRLDEDYAEELATHNKQLRTLKAKVDKLQTERESTKQRLHEMEKEISTLKRNKDELAAARMSELQFKPNSCSSEADTDERLSVSGESVLDDVNPTQDRVKILTRVLEAEYKRKMKRYDVHISTLLGNVKALKRSLKNAEQKTAVLKAENASGKVRAEDLRLTKMHLEEMRLKYEQSQVTVKALEQQLSTERKRYEASDVGKCANHSAQLQQEATHEVANLIDDYKKLIQQSAATTKRLKTSTILDLIQRSNKCVPNLNQLETSVSDLHNDVQQFLSAYTESTMQSHVGVYPFVGVYAKRSSLMDELRAAEQF